MKGKEELYIQSWGIIPDKGNNISKNHEVELSLMSMRNPSFLLLKLQSILYLPSGFTLVSLDHSPCYYFLILISMPYN